MPYERPWWRRLDGVPPGMVDGIARAHKGFDEHAVSRRPHRALRLTMGAVLGLAYGLYAAPGGALAISFLALFIWAFATAFKEITPKTWREARELARRAPASGSASGRVLACVWMAKVAMPFAVVCILTAVLRIAAGHPVNNQ